LYVNPAFEQVTGYGLAEVVGQTPLVLKSGVQDAAFYENLWITITAGQVWHGRFVNRKKDGTLYTEEAVICPVRDAGGAIVNYVAVKRNVTHELLLQEQYYHAQRMEAVGQMTASIAHDFNNILTAINGFAELASLALAPDDPLQESIRMILVSGRHAEKIIGQMLAFSRKQSAQPTVLNLNEIVIGADAMLQRIVGEAIALQVNLSPDLWTVTIDLTQVEQIVLNLVVNARDAMPQGGTLTIETSNVVLDGRCADEQSLPPGEYVRIAVSDTGVGMSNEVKARIFEPFFTTKDGQGTGLGLATVYGIVKQYGGGIQFRSEEGAGTTFQVYLPRSEQQRSVPRVVVSQMEPGMPPGGETILLVEDDPSVRAFVQRVLHNSGYTLLEAKNGQEALRLALSFSGTIHLLLTDLALPGMSGQALAGQLTSARPGMGVLFMSGRTDDVISHRDDPDMEVSFLQKPFSVMDLARKVRAVLDKGRSTRVFHAE